MPTLNKMRRQRLKIGAQGAAYAAVERIAAARHQTRGLDKLETGYASVAFGWLAAPWRSA